jgi:hypothetical protein
MRILPHNTSSRTHGNDGHSVRGGGQNDGGVTAPMITATAPEEFTQ